MSAFLQIIYILLRVYTYIVIARLVIEMIESFSRNWTPPRWFTYIAEPMFVMTDPPLKLLRRYIKPIKMGNVMLDLSPLLLFFALYLIQRIILLILSSM